MKCPECNGEGKKRWKRGESLSHEGGSVTECPLCNGTGQLPRPVQPEGIPWDLVNQEVEEAVRRIHKSRFINVRQIVDHMQGNEADYPQIHEQNQWKPRITNRRILLARVNISIKKLGWPTWNDGNSPVSGRTFIIPWVPEDPYIVRAKEAAAKTA
jgi:hypothetical protein